jgi:hypothetical protein
MFIYFDDNIDRPIVVAFLPVDDHILGDLQILKGQAFGNLEISRCAGLSAFPYHR